MILRTLAVIGLLGMSTARITLRDNIIEQLLAHDFPGYSPMAVAQLYLKFNQNMTLLEEYITEKKKRNTWGSNTATQFTSRHYPAPGRVTNLAPGFNNSQVSYSGLLPLASTANKSALFFWFFEANENPETAPVVLWLNGGPGTVSTLGLFYEMGPYRINSDLSLTTNPYAWTKKVNMVFLDQPIGVGFSVHDPDVPLPTNETMVANAVYEALLEFFRLFPEYQQRPFYVTGESYGGHFVPSIAYAILKQQGGSKSPINLQGIAVGNGWNDPCLQTAHVSEFALQNGMISGSDISLFNNLTDALNTACMQGSWLDKFAHIGLIFGSMLLIGGTEQYDFTRSHPHNESAMDLFLQQPQVRAGLHVLLDTNWTSQSTPVFLSLAEDQTRSMAPLYPYLLENIKVLIYHGLFDPCFTRRGEELFSLGLQWSGSSAFAAAGRNQWVLCDSEQDALGISIPQANCVTAGYLKSYGNLAWAEIRDAGHLVPQDQPRTALDLIQRFVQWNFDPS